jgi:hypothetical protein
MIEFQCRVCNWVRLEGNPPEGMRHDLICIACREKSPEQMFALREEACTELLGKHFEKRFHKAIKGHCSKTQQGLVMGEFRKLLGLQPRETPVDGSQG